MTGFFSLGSMEIINNYPNLGNPQIQVLTLEKQFSLIIGKFQLSLSIGQIIVTKIGKNPLNLVITDDLFVRKQLTPKYSHESKLVQNLLFERFDENFQILRKSLIKTYKSKLII